MMRLLLVLGSRVAAAEGPVETPPVPTHQDRLRALVADPATALLEDQGTSRGFRIIAMSNAAEACLRLARTGQWPHDDARDAVARLAATAVDPRFRPFEAPAGPYDHHNLYVTHWLIVVTALAELEPLHVEAQRGPSLAAHLAEVSLAHPSGVARSFPSSVARWPADQAATLYALARADATWGSDLHRGPLARYTDAVSRRESTVPGLPVSEWTGQRPFADRPRGSALAWSVRYLADVHPETAHRWWESGKPVFRSEGLGLVGFREWPPDDDHPADIDSGPILLGMSAAATAFALGASRAVDDCETWHALAKTQDAVSQMAADPEAAKRFGGVATMRAVQETALAAAIAANQATIPTSCPAPPASEPPPPR